MRFALVVEPPEKQGSVDRLTALRLGVARSGFNVVRMRNGPGLARELARALAAADDGDDALVYVAADVVIDGGAAVTDGEGTLAFSEIASSVTARSLGQVLFLVDARVQGEAKDAFRALEAVEAIVKAVAPRDRKVALLVAVESGPLSAAPSLALTRFFVHALDDVTALADDGTMRMSSCYAKMTEHPEFASSV
jgi:hypothetical protein